MMMPNKRAKKQAKQGFWNSDWNFMAGAVAVAAFFASLPGRFASWLSSLFSSPSSAPEAARAEEEVAEEAFDTPEGEEFSPAPEGDAPEGEEDALEAVAAGDTPAAVEDTPASLETTLADKMDQETLADKMAQAGEMLQRSFAAGEARLADQPEKHLTVLVLKRLVLTTAMAHAPEGFIPIASPIASALDAQIAKEAEAFDTPAPTLPEQNLAPQTTSPLPGSRK